LAFFESLKALRIHDINSQYQLWQTLIEDKTAIVEICEQSNLARHGNLKINPDYPQQCWFCYCLLFAKACDNNYKALIQVLSTGFVQHYLPILLPKTKPISELVQLQKQLQQRLKEKYPDKVLVKESFKTMNEKGVCFSLLLKRANQKPVEFLSLDGKRLKTVRLEAYRLAVKLINKK